MFWLICLMYAASLARACAIIKLTEVKYIPGSGSCQVYIGGELQIEDNGRAYKGYGMYAGGWNRG